MYGSTGLGFAYPDPSGARFVNRRDCPWYELWVNIYGYQSSRGNGGYPPMRAWDVTQENTQPLTDERVSWWGSLLWSDEMKKFWCPMNHVVKLIHCFALPEKKHVQDHWKWMIMFRTHCLLIFAASCVSSVFLATNWKLKAICWIQCLKLKG